MASVNLHNLMVEIGRLFPPIARLHDGRNALIESEGHLRQQLLECQQLASRLQVDNTRLASEVSHAALRRAQGHIIEVDYSYVPRVRRWDAALGNDHCGQIIASKSERYRRLLQEFLAYKDSFLKISAQEPADESQPYWSNPWLPPLDALCLYGLIAKHNPRLYVEVGSGNSTKYVRRAISDHGLRTRIISIDPHPRAVIDKICDEVVRKKLEDCDLELFAGLGAEDVLFVDNSHRSFQNSDVTVVFTEILPVLQSGCIYGIHDIFLPNDYPVDWLERFYNEQYLLMAYLLGGAGGDEIVCPVHFIQLNPELVEIVSPVIAHPNLEGALPIGGGFWMRRK